MPAAEDDLFPGESFWCSLGLVDLGWPVLVGVGAVAQLAVVVASPGVQVAV